MMNFLKKMFKVKCTHNWVKYGSARVIPEDNVAVQKMYCIKCMKQKSEFIYKKRGRNA